MPMYLQRFFLSLMSAIGKICNCVMLVYNGARCVHIYELYAVKQVQKYVRRLLILYSWQMLRISHYLPVHCAKGAEFASFTGHSWNSLD